MANKDLLKIALVLTIVASAGSAFATQTLITSSMSLGNSSFSPSTNVSIDGASSSGAYSLYSQHTNGNRIFWGGTNNSRVYYTTKAGGSSNAVQTAATTDNPGVTGTCQNWSSL